MNLSTNVSQPSTQEGGLLLAGGLLGFFLPEMNEEQERGVNDFRNVRSR